MSGPATLALGPFAFRAHGFGYADLSRKLDTSWAVVETAGRMDSLQWTGPTSETVAITGVLFPQEFGGTSTLEGLRLAAKNGIPLMLASVGGRILGMHAVQKIDEDRSYHDRRGEPGKNAYVIEVKKIDLGFSLLSFLEVR